MINYYYKRNNRLFTLQTLFHETITPLNFHRNFLVENGNSAILFEESVFTVQVEFRNNSVRFRLSHHRTENSAKLGLQYRATVLNFITGSADNKLNI